MRLSHPLLALLIALCGIAKAGEEDLAKHLLAKAGISRGICAMPRCGDGKLAIAIAQSSEFLIHAQDSQPSAALKALDERGLLGTRVIVEKGTSPSLPYADNMIDLIVATDLADTTLEMVSLAEVLRVLRPRGKAVLGRSTQAKGEKAALTEGGVKTWLTHAGLREAPVSDDAQGLWVEITKPPLAGVDSWSHWMHSPDNNPVSSDIVIKSPYMTQWLGKPYYMAMPVVTTVAGGRIFVASGHIAHHNREIPTLSVVTARNGYNGMVLWNRKLPEGYLVHRSAFIATDDTFYMIDGSKCLMLDSETGKEKGSIRIPSVKGEWKWMAMQDGILFVIAGEKDPAAETTLVGSGRDHWSWKALSKGYYDKPHIPWGFGTTVVAYDMAREKVLWTHREPKPIDSRAVGICNGRLSFYAPGSRLGCLDVKSGKLLWTNADGEVLKLIEEPGKGLPSTPGFRTSCMMLCTPKVLLIEAQTRMNVVGISAEDGKFLWKRIKTRNNPNMLFADGQVIVNIGKNGGTVAIDSMTGETVRDLGFFKAACTRMTACPDSFFCRGEGLGRYDRARNTYAIDGAARPGCNDGAIPANGLLYVGPWLCDCNLSLIGTMTLCSAGDFGFDHVATEEERLEVDEGNVLEVARLDIDDHDWPTYRANNQRSAGSKATVPGKVRQIWQYKPRVSAEPTPLASAGGRVLLCGGDGKVRCLDASNGKLCWDFATAGPIRLPPSLWEGRAYIGSGDGYVYALEAATGRRLWRFRAAPVERRIMVYDSLCSTWPANSGVLVADGIAYAAAGIIDRDGTYVYALDSRTGKIKWQNNATGHVSRELRKGVSVQGDLTIAKGRLWLAGGNQISPAVYDLETGSFVKTMEPMGRPSSNRGCEVGVFNDRYLIRGGRLMYSGDSDVVSSSSFGFTELGDAGEFVRAEVAPIQRTSIPPAWDDEVFVCLTTRYDQLACWDVETFEKIVEQYRERYRQVFSGKMPLWERRSAIQKLDADIKQTGSWGPQERQSVALAVAANAVVVVCEAPQEGKPHSGWAVCALDKKDGHTMWEQRLPSEPILNGVLVERRGHVVVALKDGGVVCFGEK